jgi:hypothetical protein
MDLISIIRIIKILYIRNIYGDKMNLKSIDWKEIVIALIFAILITFFLKWTNTIP